MWPCSAKRTIRPKDDRKQAFLSPIAQRWAEKFDRTHRSGHPTSIEIRPCEQKSSCPGIRREARSSSADGFFVHSRQLLDRVLALTPSHAIVRIGLLAWGRMTPHSFGKEHEWIRYNYWLSSVLRTPSSSLRQPLTTATFHVHRRKRNSKVSSVVVPTSSKGQLQVIEAKVNDKGPYRFIFDTGTTGMLINADVAKELGLKPTGKSHVGDPSDPTAIEVDNVRASTVSIGGAVFSGVDMVSWTPPKNIAAALSGPAASSD